MAGRHKIKRIKVTKRGEPARILSFTTQGTMIDGNFLYFVHRYNPPEFDAIVGKSEGEALGWLAANGWNVGWLTGAE